MNYVKNIERRPGQDVGYNNDEIKFTDEIVTYIINSYTNEAGVRKVKEKIVEIETIKETPVYIDQIVEDEVEC
jgi:ATP-dependent Lon protease